MKNSKRHADAVDRSYDSIDVELLDDFKRMLVVMGIPWMIAPGEAEAQCAWLEQNNHVDGIISDDNDSLLFGARKVLRHCFGGRKKNRMGVRPTLYTIGRISETLQLDRDGLICLAVLLGSDYSVGIKGIGPKKAVNLIREISLFKKHALAETMIDGITNGTWAPGIDSERIERLLRPRPLIGDLLSRNPRAIVETIRNAYENPAVDDCMSQFTWTLMLSNIPAIVSYAKSDRMRWTDADCRIALDPLIRKGH
jgi:DNA excision repair protein ERCC-5